MKEQLTVYKKNEVYVEIDCSQEIAMELYAFFECYVKNYQHMPLFKNHIWNGKVSFFNSKTHELPLGLLSYLDKFCEKFDYSMIDKIDHSKDINIFSDNQFESFIEEIYRRCPKKIEKRDYQIDAIRKILENKKCLIQYGTGSGKSFILYAIIYYLLKNIQGKILLIVPNLLLVKQLAQDFKSYGFEEFSDIASEVYYNSTTRDLDRKIWLCTWQSAYKFSQNIMNTVEAVIIDECHVTTKDSKVAKEILQRCVNADYRIGDSGTLFSDDDTLTRLTLFGYIGKIVAEKKTHELIQEKTLTPVQIISILLKYPDNFICKSGRSYQDEMTLIQNYQDRNKIFKYIISKINKNENIIIAVKEIEHLKRISNYLKENFKDKKIFEIYGDIDADIRNSIRSYTENNEGVIIVGTVRTIGTGVNICRLHHIILATSYKESKILRQLIGRGVRVHDSKDKIYFWEVIDDLSWVKKSGRIGVNYSYLHWLERVKVYEAEKFPHKTIKINLSDLT